MTGQCVCVLLPVPEGISAVWRYSVASTVSHQRVGRLSASAPLATSPFCAVSFLKVSVGLFAFQVAGMRDRTERDRQLL